MRQETRSGAAGALELGSRAQPYPVRSLALKRTLDLSIAVAVCILLAPLFVIVATAIKLESRGPVFFRQRRRGLNYEPITVLKFRSMTDGDSDPSERYETQQGDSRITRVGRWLRASSLDELPQLFNVLDGSMSLVGPRPLVEWESREARLVRPRRFDVKPGITGWSQVTVRNSVDFAGRLDKDVEYVERWSPWLDIRILLRTPTCVLRGEGIYPDS